MTNSPKTAIDGMGGDGMRGAISDIDPDFVFGTSQNGGLRRSTDGGKSQASFRNIFDRNIIIVEDIVDTGKTLNHILREFEELGARSIEILALLHKPEATKKPVSLKYVGFEIPDKFVVGYGLDYDGYGRNLADLYKIVD